MAETHVLLIADRDQPEPGWRASPGPGLKRWPWIVCHHIAALPWYRVPML